MNMKIRIEQFVVLSMIWYSSVYAMDSELRKFKRAILSPKQYEQFNLASEHYEKLIKAWREEAKKDKLYGPLSLVISNNCEARMVGMLLGWDPTLCYEYHEPSRHTAIYVAVLSKRVAMVNCLALYHKLQGEPDDASEYGFYGKETLKAAVTVNVPLIISKLNELQESKKIRDDLNARLEKERNRLTDYVKTHKEKYTDINYLRGMKRATF